MNTIARNGKNGSCSYPKTHTDPISNSFSKVVEMGRSTRRHRSSRRHSTSSDSDSSRSRSRSRSRSSRHHSSRSSRRNRSRSPSRSRSPKRYRHRSPQPYKVPAEPGKCRTCNRNCFFALASETNKEHANWPYWKCSHCAGKNSFNGWIYEGPLPNNAQKGISFSSIYSQTTLTNAPLQPSKKVIKQSANPSLSQMPTQISLPKSLPKLSNKLMQPTSPTLSLNQDQKKTQKLQPKPQQKLPLKQAQQPLQHPLPNLPLNPLPKPHSTNPKIKTKRNTKPCYNYNPCINNDNKINASLFNRQLYTYLATVNRNPKTYIEKHLYNIRKKFEKRRKIKNSPSPHKTKSIIYCIYSNNPKNHKIYVGQTVHTAYVRLQQHIHTYNNNPLHKYMQLHNAKTFKIFALQHVNDKSKLNKAERYWIIKLQAQINNRNPDNLNFMTPLLNTRNLNKNLKTDCSPLSKNSNRIYATREYAKRILYLNNQTNIPKYLENLHPKTLRKIISSLTNKSIQPIKPRRLTKPTIYLQHSFPPTNNITKQYFILSKTLSKDSINNLITLTTAALHKKLTPAITKQKLKIPIPTTFISSKINKRTINQIFHSAKPLLPDNIKDKISTTIIYKNLSTIGTMFFNYKTTAQQTINNLDSKYTCICKNNIFHPYHNKHEHIDSNDTTLLSIFENYFKIPNTEITTLANKGANFIVQPYTDTKIIKRHFIKDLIKFITKIAIQFKLPIFIFEEWKQHIINKFSLITLQHQTTLSNFNTIKIKNLLQKIHEHITITPTDKMKNNFRFTCSQYTQRIIAQKITALPTLVHNTPETTNKISYELINKTPNEIMLSHQTYLETFQLSSPYNKLPYLYIIHKAHKFGNRGVTAAFNVTTSKLAKTLHTGLRHIIKELQKNDNALSQINQTNRHWRIDNATDVNYLLHQFNTSNNTPSTVQSYDIEGFYDNIDIPEMEKILDYLIPLAFTIAKAKYISINPTSNKAYWTNYKQTQTFKYHNSFIFSSENIIELQKWHLNNAHIQFNNKVWKQIKGIGQGTNQSPDLANLILMYYEHQFIDYHTTHNKEIAKAFKYTTRKMDDILFINNPQAHKYIYKNTENPNGIYPQKFFTLTTESPPSDNTNYLDMHIHIANTPNNCKKAPKLYSLSLQQLRNLAKRHGVSSRDNKDILISKLQQKFNTIKSHSLYTNKEKIWNTKTYNKTDKFTIKAINFPHYTSNTPQTIMTGSIIGRLHSYTITNTYKLKDFLNTASKLFDKLININKYPTKLIHSAINRFTSRHKTNYPVKPQKLNQLLIQCMGNVMN